MSSMSKELKIFANPVNFALYAIDNLYFEITQFEIHIEDHEFPAFQDGQFIFVDVSKEGNIQEIINSDKICMN